MTADPTTTPHAEPRLVVDGTGLLCVMLLLKLRAAIQDARPGAIVHVIATDPAAPLDLPAWCHMTGHTYLGELPADNGNPSTYAVRLAARPVPTRPDAPWHRAPGDTPRGTQV